MLLKALPAVALAVVAGCGGSSPPPSTTMDTCTGRYAVTRRRPEVIVVLDRSCAMRAVLASPATNASGASDPTGRWGATVSALQAAVTGTPATGWGLVMLPSDPTSCTIGALDVPPGPGTAMTSALRATDASPFSICSGDASELPLEPALVEAVNDASIGTTGMPFVLVIAAGAPSCGSTTDSLRAAAGDLGFDMAVIGLAPDADAATLLQSLVPEGRYHAVTDAAGLETAVTTEIAGAANCILDLATAASPDGTALRVWADGTAVPADPDQGFSYSPSDGSITLNGGFCTRLSANAIHEIDVAVGCDVRRCVPTTEICDGLDNDCNGHVDEGCT